MTVEKFRAHLLDLNLRSEDNLEEFENVITELKIRRDKFIQDVVKKLEKMYPPKPKDPTITLNFDKFKKDCDKNSRSGQWNHFMYWDLEDKNTIGYTAEALKDMLQKKLIARNNENSWRVYHSWKGFITQRVQNDPQDAKFSGQSSFTE